MAVLQQQVLGVVRGKFGNNVGRLRYGKNILAALPSQYTMSQAPHEVDKRSRFKVNGKFAKAVKMSELLYGVWEKKKAPAKNAWNKICKVNFELCGTDRPAEKNVITPGGGFGFRAVEITAMPGGIEVIPEPFDILSREDLVIFIMIVSHFEPRNKKNDHFELVVMQGCETDGDRLIFKYDEDEKKLAGRYKHRTVFLAAVTMDKKGNIVRWSKTAAAEL